MAGDRVVQEAEQHAAAPLRVLFVSRWLVGAAGGGVQTYIANAARALAGEPITLEFAALMHGSRPNFAMHAAHFGKPGSPKWLNAWRLRAWLRKALLDLDLVVIHGVTDWHFIVAATQCRQLGLPYVVLPAGGLLRVPFVRSNLRRIGTEIFLRFVVAPFLRAAACVIASTARERDGIQAIDPRIRTRVLPGGTEVPDEPTGVALRAQPELPLRGVFLGRLEPIKGLPVLFRAMQILDREQLPMALDVVGSGAPAYERELRAEAEKVGVAARVTFHGDLRGEAKRAKLADSHVLILPSDSENFGFVVVEAMAQGVPVVVSDGVGLADTVRRCGAGQVFPRGQSEALASALSAYRESALLQAQARQAHRCAQKEFSIEAMGTALSELFQEVARRPTEEVVRKVHGY
jgi:glycosyltransferase involved in cell wall biosynthesis